MADREQWMRFELLKGPDWREKAEDVNFLWWVWLWGQMI